MKFTKFAAQKLKGAWKARRCFESFETAMAFVEAHVELEGGRWRVSVTRAHRGLAAGSVLWRS